MGNIYDSSNYHPRNSIGSLLGRVKVAMMAAFDEELAADRRLSPLGLSAAQFSVMASLADEERKSASDLCRFISYDAGAMTRMLDRLEAKGLIGRNRSPEDRRLVYLELTEAGRAAYPRMRELALEVANRFLRGFSKAEARQLESLLMRMLENAESPAVRASA